MPVDAPQPAAASHQRGTRWFGLRRAAVLQSKARTATPADRGFRERPEDHAVGMTSTPAAAVQDDAREVAEPYLSVVVAARNDDHGGGFLERMQVFVDAFVNQCARHQVAAELILVEWNPLPGRPGLREVIRWPSGAGSTVVRIIRVAPEIHARFAHSDQLPLFQMIAKNAGIRRARAPFVLATNIDLIFSDGVMNALARRSLKTGTLYRVDRHDVDSNVPADAPVAQQLRWCELHRIRISRRRGTEDLRTGAFYPIYTSLRDLPRFTWNALLRHRFGAIAAGGRFVRRHVLRRRLVAGFRRLLLRSRVRPHTNACGDFTLLAREDWLALRGYPELEIYSLHIDSLLLYMSRHAGNRERVLKAPVYHIEHTTGYHPDREGQRPLFDWLARARIPRITQGRFEEYILWMAERRRPLDLNTSDWGLFSEELPEDVFVC